MQWITSQAEHIGGRSEQQDRACILCCDDEYLLVLADGMGGHSGGALAAQAVIDTAKLLWQTQKHPTPHPDQFLSHFCEQANQAILQVGQKQDLEPHSTCVALYIQGQRAWFIHLGDSRLYHFRHNTLQQRTKDHSLVQMLVDLGRLKESEMGSHQRQACLLKGLGRAEQLEPDLNSLNLQENDYFLLCSDGLWEYISDTEMYQAMQSRDLDLSLNALTQLAVTRAGKRSDNVMLIVCLPQISPKLSSF
jgi:serine/threonine protein phosphatase PrpC